MRCQYYGSSCGDPLPHELATAVALSLCDQLAELGITGVSLTGGEPFMRPDWSNIAGRHSSRHHDQYHYQRLAHRSFCVKSYHRTRNQ